MKWNNRKERYYFECKQRKLREQYISFGMAEEEIQKLYELDLAEFNGRRREAEHTYRLDKTDLDIHTVEIESGVISRYAWMDEIENESIVAAIKSLSIDDLELLTKYIVEGFSLSDIARIEQKSPQAISKKFKKIKKFFKKGCENGFFVGS